VVCVGLLVAGVVPARCNRLHPILKDLLRLSQIMEQAGELALPARAKPHAKSFRAFGDAS